MFPLYIKSVYFSNTDIFHNIFLPWIIAICCITTPNK